MSVTPFHLAFPVHDLATARRFYLETLGCEAGRAADTWFDFSLFGHQMSAHLREGGAHGGGSGAVDGTDVPIPHFGVVLTMEQWKSFAERLEATPGIDWICKPMVRFAGEPGEQATLFVRDPSGNALEFKGFASFDTIFAA
ncbi:VOC family protein [Oricola sp.]|uniref:VOC family protein n=1 Tax=Oricola sp. TaxID=1979950 RepID=UPI003BAA1DA8